MTEVFGMLGVVLVALFWVIVGLAGLAVAVLVVGFVVGIPLLIAAKALGILR